MRSNALWCLAKSTLAAAVLLSTGWRPEYRPVLFTPGDAVSSFSANHIIKTGHLLCWLVTLTAMRGDSRPTLRDDFDFMLSLLSDLFLLLLRWAKRF